MVSLVADEDRRRPRRVRPPLAMKRIYALAVVQCAVLGALTAPVVVGLSLMVTRLVGDEDAPTALGMIIACGSAAAMIANPLIGWCVDRTPRRRGGRRVWLLGGAVAGLAGSTAVAFAGDIPSLLLAWVGTQAAYNACFAGVNSLVSRGLAEEHRVRVGAVFTAVSFLGVLPGLAAAALFSASTVTMTLAVPAVATVVVFVIALRLRDDDAPVSDAMAARGRAVDLRAILTRPFVAVMTVRFVIGVELTAGLVFALYLFRDRWDLAEPEAVRLVSATTLVGSLGLLLASLLLSVVRRRRPRPGALLGAALVVLAAGMIARAVAPTPLAFQAATFFAGAAIGIGFASTRAVVQSVLPPDHAAFGLGVFNIANTLSAIVAPPLASGLLAVAGGAGWDPYAGMYVMLALPVLACIAVLPALRPRPVAVPVGADSVRGSAEG